MNAIYTMQYGKYIINATPIQSSVLHEWEAFVFYLSDIIQPVFSFYSLLIS